MGLLKGLAYSKHSITGKYHCGCSCAGVATSHNYQMSSRGKFAVCLWLFRKWTLPRRARHQARLGSSPKQRSHSRPWGIKGQLGKSCQASIIACNLDSASRGKRILSKAFHGPVTSESKVTWITSSLTHIYYHIEMALGSFPSCVHTLSQAPVEGPSGQPWQK